MLTVLISTNFENVITTIFEPQSVSFSKKLFGSGTLKFSIKTRDVKVENIKQFNKIQLFYNDGKSETEMFNGYIANLEVDLSNIAITCFCGRELLKRKYNPSTTDQTAKTPIEIIQWLIDESNYRDNTNKLTLSSNLIRPITITAEKTNYNSIIDNVVDMVSGQWYVDKNNIVALDRIGENKLDQNNYFELVSSLRNPNSSNILNLKATLESTSIVTNLWAKNNTGTIRKRKNVDEFGSIEMFNTFEDGDLETQATEFINKRSTPMRSYSLEVDRTIGINDVNVGDSIWLRVEQEISLLDTFEPYVITEKTVSFDYGKPLLKLELSNDDLPKNDIASSLSYMNQRIIDLENL